MMCTLTVSCENACLLLNPLHISCLFLSIESSSTKTVTLLWEASTSIKSGGNNTSDFMMKFYWTASLNYNIFSNGSGSGNDQDESKQTEETCSRGKLPLIQVCTGTGRDPGDLQGGEQVIQYNGLGSSDASTQENQLQKAGRNRVQSTAHGRSVEKENLCCQEGRQQWCRRRAPEPSPASLRREDCTRDRNTLQEDWDVG